MRGTILYVVYFFTHAQVQLCSTNRTSVATRGPINDSFLPAVALRVPLNTTSVLGSSTRMCEVKLCKGSKRRKICKMYDPDSYILEHPTLTVCDRCPCKKKVLSELISQRPQVGYLPKRVLIFGDSLSRQFFGTLLCLLGQGQQKGLTAKEFIWSPDGYIVEGCVNYSDIVMEVCYFRSGDYRFPSAFANEYVTFLDNVTKDDLVLANFGVHWNSRDLPAQNTLKAQCEGFARAVFERDLQETVIWRETFAQHFWGNYGGVWRPKPPSKVKYHDCGNAFLKNPSEAKFAGWRIRACNMHRHKLKVFEVFEDSLLAPASVHLGLVDKSLLGNRGTIGKRGSRHRRVRISSDCTHFKQPGFLDAIALRFLQEYVLVFDS